MRRGISVDRVCLFSSGRKKGEKKMNTGLIAIFILLVIIVGAIVTRRCVVSLIVCFMLYVPQKVVALDDFFNLIVRGFADMLPILILLVIAFVLQKVTEGMGMTDFIISVAKPLLWGPVFPAIAFVLVAALTFTTGSLWGIRFLRHSRISSNFWRKKRLVSLSEGVRISLLRRWKMPCTFIFMRRMRFVWSIV